MKVLNWLRRAVCRHSDKSLVVAPDGGAVAAFNGKKNNWIIACPSCGKVWCERKDQP